MQYNETITVNIDKDLLNRLVRECITDLWDEDIEEVARQRVHDLVDDEMPDLDGICSDAVNDYVSQVVDIRQLTWEVISDHVADVIDNRDPMINEVEAKVHQNIQSRLTLHSEWIDSITQDFEEIRGTLAEAAECSRRIDQTDRRLYEWGTRLDSLRHAGFIARFRWLLTGDLK